MESNAVYKKAHPGRSLIQGKPNERMRTLLVTFVACIFGFFIGISVPEIASAKLSIKSSLICNFPNGGVKIIGDSDQKSVDSLSHSTASKSIADENQKVTNPFKIWEPSNPRGAERLAPQIVVNESDFFLRRLWGKPSEDLPKKPKYLVTFTVGYNQRSNIDAAVKKITSPYFSSITMVEQMNGMSLSGPSGLFMLALINKQNGGMPKGFCIQILLHLTTISLSGTRILGLNILLLKSL